jgi:hypothetical protein
MLAKQGVTSMAHTLDVSKLPQIFEALRENVHKLNSWECDRLEEWEQLYERTGQLSDGQLETIEQMYLKV